MEANHANAQPGKQAAQRSASPGPSPQHALPLSSSPQAAACSVPAAGPWTTAFVRPKSWALPVPGQGRGQTQNRQTRTGHRQGGGQSSHLAAGTWRQAPTCQSGVDTLLGRSVKTTRSPKSRVSTERPLACLRFRTPLRRSGSGASGLPQGRVQAKGSFHLAPGRSLEGPRSTTPGTPPLRKPEAPEAAVRTEAAGQKAQPWTPTRPRPRGENGDNALRTGPGAIAPWPWPLGTHLMKYMSPFRVTVLGANDQGGSWPQATSDHRSVSGS